MKQSPPIALRIILDIALAACVVFGWWYVAVPIGIIGLAKFRYFGEIVAAGFVFDALYGIGLPVGVQEYAGTLVGSTLAFISLIIKSSVR